MFGQCGFPFGPHPFTVHACIGWKSQGCCDVLVITFTGRNYANFLNIYLIRHRISRFLKHLMESVGEFAPMWCLCQVHCCIVECVETVSNVLEGTDNKPQSIDMVIFFHVFLAKKES